MKTKTMLLILSLFVMCTCSKAPVEKGTGYLTLNINQNTSLKAGIEIDDFTLRISNGYTEVLKMRFGDLPEEIALPVGTYTIEAYSSEFYEPMFETLLYSGSVTVEIEADENTEASLNCGLGNAGIKVVWSEEFAHLFTTYQAQIECDEGYLNYESNEERTGYFLPGTVSVSILADGKSIYGGTITLAAGDIVTATLHPKIKVDPTGGLTINITIDETVKNRAVDITFDPDDPGDQDNDNSETNPYTIEQAMGRYSSSQTVYDVWVAGYIVGSKPSTDYDFVNGIWQATNIVLADDISEEDDRNVIFVDLATALYRNNLSLVGNESYLERLHRKVVIRGNLRQFQYRAGLRDLAGFSYIE